MNKQIEIQQMERTVEIMRVKLKESEQHLVSLKAANKLHKGQQVLVRDSQDEAWRKGILLDIDDHDNDCNYIVGHGEFTYCIPDTLAVTLPVWHEHDGSPGPSVQLEGDQFCIYYKVGMGMEGRYASNIPWSIVTRYCPVPEYRAL